MNDTPVKETERKPLSVEEAAIIKFMGENIFPVALTIIAEKFGETEIISLAEAGHLVKSIMRIGTNLTAMRKTKGLIELSDSGWNCFKDMEAQQSKQNT